MFTGKERDAETGLDYFGARYYGAALGRFKGADWSAIPQPVPYADLTDPQTLNLFSYVRNNPLSKADPDGHCGLAGGGPYAPPCSLSQFMASLPDRVVGGLKGEGNVFLDMIGVAPKFQPSNAEQAEAMNNVNDVAPEMQTALSMVIPGPKGAKGKALPNEAIVVRGGI